MSYIRIMVATIAMTVALGSTGAYAFAVDLAGTDKDGARLADPDDTIPFLHVSDDARMLNDLQPKAGGIQIPSVPAEDSDVSTPAPNHLHR